MRIRNPEIIYATWASSAPVHAQIDMASYYKAAERSLTRNCSADWVAVTKYVDETLNGTDKERITDIKFALEFARLSGKGGNTTLAANLTKDKATRMSNLDSATILMDPLDFYQVNSKALGKFRCLKNLVLSTTVLRHPYCPFVISLKLVTLPPIMWNQV